MEFIVSLSERFFRPGRITLSGLPEGLDAMALAAMARELAPAGRPVLFVARDDLRLQRMAEALAFFAPGVERLEFPAWDCLPYDRASPAGEVVARRIDTLTRLLEPPSGGVVVLTAVAALMQRVPARKVFADAVLSGAAGDRMAPERITEFLVRNGYGRAETVMEPGEFAIRGGILDVFPAGCPAPLRLDFFGDELDQIRTFDPATQRTTGMQTSFRLKPVSEVFLDEASISRFRSTYRALFGAVQGEDPLYEAVSAGRRHIGMEHWLALFHEHLETLFDYLPEAVAVLDHQAELARDARAEAIAEYFTARLDDGTGAGMGALPYHPVPPERLYLGAGEWEGLLADRAVVAVSPFAAPEGEGVLDAGGRAGHDFAAARVAPGVNVFDAVRTHIADQRAEGRRVVIGAFGRGSRDRLMGVLAEHRVEGLRPTETWAEVEALPAHVVAVVAVGLERGFVTPGLAVIAEQDILGDRLVRAAARRIRPENFIAEATALAEGDLVVHVDHGIGRYDGLAAIEVSGAPHDCLRILYEGGDKLFLPVENVELISRYGSETAGVQLDRLGSAAWQARKARMKKRVREMADQLIQVAARRELRPGAVLETPEGLYDEFCAAFPYAETDDQARAIADTLDDLGRGRPMDRLVCGDVGFGKTEVALRAAFVTAMGCRQVAVVVPTTLLCRQHFRIFRERFASLPVRIAEISRLVTARDASVAREGIASGAVDVVIGTHALLAKTIRFKNLGLLVVDEEQHFGVAHKERLKALKADVHVLTLTATPIPRTLQLALTGVREMSLIATPPVDRIAVRTFVLPFDPVVIREALLRERFRGGQIFYVCPRIEDLDEVAAQLKSLVPDFGVVMVHGRMAAREIEDAMAAFYEGRYDVLLSTNIIESGLDLPRVNTIVIHRADMFGLAGLYQLRGRVGRAKVRAYAYLTLPPRRKLTAAAEKRLEVMQTLDSLGAGFTLASHDLDIRGAGNLLGEEQSGHIREVGIELYQQMLEEAVTEARGSGAAEAEEEWSPQIGIGIPVLIPEDYVFDLGVRLGLYRRLAGLGSREEIDAFAAEMIDRFGPLPGEVENLLQTVALKRLCREAGIARIDAGPKGATVAFRNDRFANPAGLVAYLQRERGVKLRPDHTLLFRRDFETPADRLGGVKGVVAALAGIARAMIATKISIDT